MFTRKLYYLKVAKKLPEYLGYFSGKICFQEVRKIAQSSHTASKPNDDLI